MLPHSQVQDKWEISTAYLICSLQAQGIKLASCLSFLRR